MPPARSKAPDPHFQAAAVEDTVTSPVGSLDGKRPVRVAPFESDSESALGPVCVRGLGTWGRESLAG